MKSSYSMNYSETGQLVFFDIDVKELFGVDLNTPGVPTALNRAFNISKSAVPIKTGLMLRSYSMKKISNTAVRCYFDPNKIIGQTRKGRTVKEYYPQYLVEYPSRLNWLDILIKTFYNALRDEMSLLSKKNKDIDISLSDALWILLILSIDEKAKKEKKIREEKEKRKQKIRETREKFRKSIKNGGK